MRTIHDARQTAGTVSGWSPAYLIPRDQRIARRCARPTPQGCAGRPGWTTIQPLYRPTKGGAAGAGKIIGTDYWLAGPGRATRKPVGRGVPRTPSPEGGIA